MRKLIVHTLLVSTIPLSVAMAGVDPIEFSDDKLLAAPLLQGQSVESVPKAKQVPLVVTTHKLTQADNASAALIKRISGDVTESTNTASKVVFENRKYKGMMPCGGPCPVDPDEFRNTLVHIEALKGDVLIDLIRSILPTNWTVMVDNVNPRKLIESYAFVTTDTREKSLMALESASDLKFKFFHDNYNDDQIHSPILIVYPGE